MYVIFRNLPQTGENRITFGVIDNGFLKLLKSLREKSELLTDAIFTSAIFKAGKDICWNQIFIINLLNKKASTLKKKDPDTKNMQKFRNFPFFYFFIKKIKENPTFQLNSSMINN